MKTQLKRYAVKGIYKSGRKAILHVNAISALSAIRLVEANQRKQGVQFTGYAANHD